MICTGGSPKLVCSKLFTSGTSELVALSLSRELRAMLRKHTIDTVLGSGANRASSCGELR